MHLYMRNGKNKIRVLPQHISYVHLATVRAMYWISTNNLCYGSTSVLRWHISSNSVFKLEIPAIKSYSLTARLPLLYTH